MKSKNFHINHGRKSMQPIMPSKDHPHYHQIAKKIHDDIVDRLEGILLKENIHCLKYVPWSKNGHNGEIDLIAIHPSGKLEFYEVKCTEHESKFFKAQRQYANFREAYRQKPRDFPGYVYFGSGTQIPLPKNLKYFNYIWPRRKR
jgi:hypothetical protein